MSGVKSFLGIGEEETATAPQAATSNDQVQRDIQFFHGIREMVLKYRNMPAPREVDAEYLEAKIRSACFDHVGGDQNAAIALTNKYIDGDFSNDLSYIRQDEADHVAQQAESSAPAAPAAAAAPARRATAPAAPSVNDLNVDDPSFGEADDNGSVHHSAPKNKKRQTKHEREFG